VTSSLSQSLSSISSPIKKPGFAPSYGGASTTLPINSLPEMVGLINNLSVPQQSPENFVQKPLPSLLVESADCKLSQ
jgi:hypothetical protein